MFDHVLPCTATTTPTNKQASAFTLFYNGTPGGEGPRVPGHTYDTGLCTRMNGTSLSLPGGRDLRGGGRERVCEGGHAGASGTPQPGLQQLVQPGHGAHPGLPLPPRWVTSCPVPKRLSSLRYLRS